MNREDNDDVVDYGDFSVEPSSFLNIKKGDQLKNKKVLKTKLSEIDNSLNITEKELYLILYYSELLMDDKTDDGLLGDNSDAIDSLNDIMDKCSQISDLLEEIKEIKNKL
jgi:hypothetical protein